MLIKKHFLSDLDVRLTTRPWEEHDWVLYLYTNMRKQPFVASYINGVAVNCFNDNGITHVVMKNHGLKRGRLFIDTLDYIPNKIYPDGIQKVVDSFSTELELVRECADEISTVDIEVMLPYIKGEPFRYEDFTEEQLDDLRRPATEAAIEAMRSAGHAEEKAELARQAAAQATEATESMRETEAAVADAETMREAAEGIREEAESKRIVAEEQRAKTFAGMRDELADKPDRSELSNIIGQPTEKHIASVEETIITDALRKTAQVLTPQEQEQVKKNLAISKMELFCDQFNAAVGDHGYARIVDGVFECELGGLKLTYEQAIISMDAGHLLFGANYQYSGILGLRVNLPPASGINNTSIGNRQFEEFDGEVIILAKKKNGFARFSSFSENSITGKKIRRIATRFANCSEINLRKCPVLEDVVINPAIADINISGSPVLSLKSVQTIVDYAANTTAITVTVHPDIYAKLIDVANADWHKVMTDGAAKNIIFATI